jgi:hypothetical protein
MEKPVLQINESQPKNIQRADLAPTDGYSLVVDGHIKTLFDGEDAAKKAAKDLLKSYPMLRVEIYDASTKQRTPVG